MLAAMRRLQTAPLAELRSLDWLADLVREVGLVPIPEAAVTYVGEEDFINGTQQGLIQLPREFARCGVNRSRGNGMFGWSALSVLPMISAGRLSKVATGTVSSAASATKDELAPFSSSRRTR